MKTFLKLIGSFAVVCAVILFVPRGAFAQGYGSISGTVTDATGAVVPGAAVTATQAGTGLVAKTTSSSGGHLRVSDPGAFGLQHIRQPRRI